MDDTPTSSGTARQRPAVSSGIASAPPPASLRRSHMASAAVDDARRSSRSSSHMYGNTFSATETSSSPSFEGPPRRSSNFSDLSLSEARDILNPQPIGRGVAATGEESSSLASLSLAFGILPAIAGVLFKNGSAIATDVMLLGLAGVFLHWSVTQPWAWYHSAQEVRVLEEESTDSAIEDDSDVDSATTATMHRSPLGNVPEEEEAMLHSDTEDKTESTQRTAQQQSALKELYAYEILALISCFMFPIMGAYLLHTIRSQLSRPSEGLVSNYNLTIFLLASELRVLLHMIKLVQSRTLHLHRVVLENPDGSLRTTHSAEQMEAVLTRLEHLELHLTAEGSSAVQGGKPETSKTAQENALARDVRNAIQPDLDALNRAVRRYEKKATLLQFQTESRFAGMDARLDDAIALAASAAKNSASHTGVLRWAIDSLTAMIRLPFKALLRILLLPLSTLLALTSKEKKKGAPTRMSRSSRNGGKVGMQARYSGDRPPTRVSKR